MRLESKSVTVHREHRVTLIGVQKPGLIFILCALGIVSVCLFVRHGSFAFAQEMDYFLSLIRFLCERNVGEFACM